jgi:hypothetical protein
MSAARPMELVLQFFSVLVLVGLVALFVRFGGRLFARTTIQWTICLKYAVIVAFCLLVLSYLGLVGATAATGFWVGIVLVLAAHAAVGAIYLGPRVIKQAGQNLGPVKAAMVGAGAAVLGLGFLAILLLVLGMLGLIRG